MSSAVNSWNFQKRRSATSLWLFMVCFHFHNQCFELSFSFKVDQNSISWKFLYVFHFQQEKRSQVLLTTLYRYLRRSLRNHRQPARQQIPARRHVASLHPQEQSSTRLTSPAERALSAPLAVRTVSRQTQVRTLFYYHWKIKRRKKKKWQLLRWQSGRLILLF